MTQPDNHPTEQSNPAELKPEECDHDWKTIDASFDHEFGTERIFYDECQKCGATKTTEPHQHDE